MNRFKQSSRSNRQSGKRSDWSELEEPFRFAVATPYVSRISYFPCITKPQPCHLIVNSEQLYGIFPTPHVMTKNNTEDTNSADPSKPIIKRQTTTTSPFPDPHDEAFAEHISAVFRGIAAATRKAALVAKKTIIANTTGGSAKEIIRAVGETRPLAFASEGAVAGEAIIPRWVFYGAWGLSGLAIGADVYTKYDDAPESLKNNTALYWTAFHIPASLVVPAAIIHQVVHFTEKMVENPTGIAKNVPPRFKPMLPVAAAMFSIIPVVPAVDYTAEAIMEPTLGSYLGLEFHHHHHDDHSDADPTKKAN